MIRLSLALTALFVLAGCETLPAALRPITETRTPPPASPTALTPPPTNRSAQASEQLLDLERRLAGAAQEQGLGGALGPVLDPTDGFVLRPGVMYQGSGSVEAGLNASNTGPIMWQPDRVYTSDQGDMGLTSGRYVQVVPGREAIQGRYIAVWRRDSTGEWRLLTETRVPDPPRPAPAPARRR